MVPPPHPFPFLSQSLRPLLLLTSAWLARGGRGLVVPEEKCGAGWRSLVDHVESEGRKQRLLFLDFWVVFCLFVWFFVFC